MSPCERVRCAHREHDQPGSDAANLFSKINKLHKQRIIHSMTTALENEQQLFQSETHVHAAAAVRIDASGKYLSEV